MMRRLLALLLTATWFALATEPAHAGPLAAAVGSVFSLFTGAGLFATVARIGLAVGLSYLSNLFTQRQQTSTIGGVTGRLSAGDTVPHSIVVGRGVADPSFVYGGTYGADGGTPNAYLAQVIELANLSGHVLAEIWFKGEKLTYNPAATPETEGIPIPEYPGLMWFRYYDGTQTAADARLVTLFGSAERPYQSTRVGYGICYVVVVTKVDENAFGNNFPAFTFVLDGPPMYDRREDTTAGGSGSQRLATPATWTRTRNPIVINENIVRGLKYADGTWAYGGQTVGVGQLPAAAWFAAANECDAAIDLVGGGTEPQFEAGGCVHFSDEPASVIEELNKTCNGKLAEIGGIYKPRAGAPGAAVFSFTDDDIRTTDAQTFKPFPALADTVNAVTAKYIAPDEGWAEKDAPPLYDTSLETEDGGRRQAVDVRYGFVTSGTQVQRLMRSERDSHRAFREHALPLSFEAFVLEPFDVVAFGSARNGYAVDKAFDLTAIDDRSDLNADIQIRELDPNAYDWTPASDEQPIVNGPLARVVVPPQAMVDWAVAPVTLSGDDGRAKAGIRLTWNADSDHLAGVSGVRFRVRRASDAALIYAADTYDPSAGTIDITGNIVGATAYEVQGEYIPTSARAVTASSWLPVTTDNVGLTPAELGDVLTRKLNVLDATLDESFATDIARLRDSILRLSNYTSGIAAQIDSSLQETVFSFGAETDTSRAQVAQYAAALADADSAFAALLTVIQATVGDNTASIASEAITRSNVDGALTTLVNTAQSTADGAVSSIGSEATTRSNADGALTTRIDVMSTNFGGATTSHTVTITIAAPAVVSWVTHGLAVDRRVRFTTTGALPTGLTAGTDYFVISAGLATNSFRVSATLGGSAVNTSGSQSGTHTATAESLSASIATASASIASESSTRSSADGALATRADLLEANLGGAASSHTVTISIASPAVVTWASHGLVAGRRVVFSTTGALPTGLTAGAAYFVISAGLASGSFRVSATFGGSAVNTSGSQSGTHTATAESTSASIASETSASATRDAAIAASLSSFIATSGSSYAEGTIRFLAATTASDATASFKIELRATVGDAWVATGFYMDTGSFAGGKTRRVRIDTDQFYITDGTYFDAPFSVVGGVARAKKVVAGSIDTNSIAADSIAVTHLKINSVGFDQIIAEAVSKSYTSTDTTDHGPTAYDGTGGVSVTVPYTTGVIIFSLVSNIVNTASGGISLMQVIDSIDGVIAEQYWNSEENRMISKNWMSGTYKPSTSASRTITTRLVIPRDPAGSDLYSTSRTLNAVWVPK